MKTNSNSTEKEEEAAAAAMLSLPEDIQVDIFLRLPEQSIITCKCVCKPWFNLISSRKFINFHLTHNKNNHRLMLLTRTPEKRRIWSVDYASISISSSGWSADYASILSSPGTCKFMEDIPVCFPFDVQSEIRVLGCCNGLICLGNYTLTSVCFISEGIFVWNPTTRECKNIPLPSLPSNISGGCYHDSDSTAGYILYGFGYDRNMDDYKLVRIVYCGSENSVCIKSEVHTLGSDLWRTIIHADPGYSFVNNYTGLFLNGFLHWLGVTTDQKQVIACFGVSNERLIDMPFPGETMQHYYTYVAVLDDCLCLLNCEGFYIDVWVMLNYGMRKSWTKRFTFTQKVYFCRSFCDLKPFWSLRNGGILIHTDEGFILCDPNDGNIKKLKVFCQGDTLEGGFVYAKSLVSPNSGIHVGKVKSVGAKRIATRTYMQALIN